MVQDNRTFVCSVLFLDIVAYSEQPVADQLQIKQRFNALLGNALRNTADNDRIVLDTGDGAAISFLGNPEDALFVAIELRDALSADDPVAFEVRFGINLGPVRMINDINQRANIIGNGINVAQRIMSFAAPGQILVSRSYYEVVACLSSDYAQLFSYSGSHTDKHVHEHETYLVGAPGPGLRPPTLIEYAPPSSEGLGQRIRQSWDTVQEQVQTRWQKHVGARRPAVAAVGGVLMVTGIFAVAAALNIPAPGIDPLAADQGLEPDLPTAGESAEILALADDSNPAETTVSRDPDTAPAVATAQTEAHPVASKARSAGSAPANPHNASLRVRITPWGEAYIDGTRQGVCSPICELDVPPGTRRIEARNPSAAAKQQILALESGQQKTVSFSF